VATKADRAEVPENLETPASDSEIRSQTKDDKAQAKELAVKSLDGKDDDSVISQRQTAHGPQNRAVFPDQASRETGYEPFYGHFAQVTKGEHEGTIVVVDEVVGWEEDGRPAQVRVHPKRSPGFVFVVNYEDLGPRPEEA
jgi:hypothetical protein